MSDLHQASGGVRLRGANVHDVAAIGRVWAAAWMDGHYGHVPATLLAARDAEYFLEYARRLIDLTVVAVDADGTLAGLVITNADELVQLGVKHGSRNAGVGAALLDAAERRIAGGFPRAWLAVVPGNVRARNFYTRRGWLDEGEVSYSAPSLTGLIPVPVRRYVKPLCDRV